MWLCTRSARIKDTLRQAVCPIKKATALKKNPRSLSYSFFIARAYFEHTFCHFDKKSTLFALFLFQARKSGKWQQPHSWLMLDMNDFMAKTSLPCRHFSAGQSPVCFHSIVYTAWLKFISLCLSWGDDYGPFFGHPAMLILVELAA